MRLILAVAALLWVTTAALAQTRLADTTQMSYSSFFGTQVEYLARDGSSWLWFPGNRVIVPGAWKTQGDLLCFRYGSNSYNPATGQYGGSWECTPLNAYNASRVETVRGDALHLKGRGAVPYVLSKARTSFDRLIDKVRRSDGH